MDEFAAWLLTVFEDLLQDIFEIMQDAFIWCIEVVADLAIAAMDGFSIDLPTLPETVSAFPPDVIMVLDRIGFDVAIATLTTAYTAAATIRAFSFVLRLIPGI